MPGPGAGGPWGVRISTSTSDITSQKSNSPSRQSVIASTTSALHSLNLLRCLPSHARIYRRRRTPCIGCAACRARIYRRRRTPCIDWGCATCRARTLPDTQEGT
eukprot:3279117-Prymnesium_polylepis.1